MLNVGALREGYVLDHIKAGKAMTIYHDLKLDKLDCTVAIIKNARSKKMGKKDIITKEYMEDTEVFADVFNHMIYKGEKFSVGSCPCNGGDDWNEDRKKRRGRNGECL